MFPTLLALVRQQYLQDPAVTQTATALAAAVLDGARDRSRDRHLRPFLDQQRRTAPLTHVRRRARPRPRVPRKARRVAPAKLLCGRDGVGA